MSEQTKFCSRCKLTKALERFADCLMTPDFKQHWCRDCMRVYRRSRRLAFKNSVEVPS